MKHTTHFHISRIKEVFEERQLRNQKYSLRAFSRDLEMSPAALSDLLRMKKGLSQQKALKISKKIGLQEREQEIFVLSAVSAHGRSQSRRTQAQNVLKKISPVRKASVVSIEDFEKIQSWHCMAILNLIELKTCQHTPEWFSKKLQLAQPLIETALSRLIKAGLLELQGHKYVAVQNEIQVKQDISSRSIRNFHNDLLNKAERALHFQDLNEREFQNLTLAFAQEDMPEAKKMIRDFIRQFSETFYQKEKSLNSVHQLSMQFFRIDQKMKD